METDKQTGGVLHVEWRGRERYSATWEHQLRVHAARRQDDVADRLILVEHEPVITMGRQGDMANLVTSDEELKARGIDFHRVERGGDVTFHGPGQLVGYPIVNLRERGLSVRALMRGLEEAIILTLAEYGVAAKRIEGLTGVWRTIDTPAGARDEKLAALGVAVRGGVSFHGLAFNVDPDLSYFHHIIPCGLQSGHVASLATAGGGKPSLEEVGSKLSCHLASVFGYTAISTYNSSTM